MFFSVSNFLSFIKKTEDLFVEWWKFFDYGKITTFWNGCPWIWQQKLKQPDLYSFTFTALVTLESLMQQLPPFPLVYSLY